MLPYDVEGFELDSFEFIRDVSELSSAFNRLLFFNSTFLNF